MADELGLEVLVAPKQPDEAIAGGYATDLLSCAMSGAKKGYVWVTLQSHMNVVAVASLLGLAAVVITEGNRPDDETTARAESENVALMVSQNTTFAVVGRLWALGVRDGLADA
jgi:hypothetical protein